MEALGGVSGILTIIDAAAAVAGLIQKVRDAPSDLIEISNEATDVQKVLLSLRWVMTKVEEAGQVDDEKSRKPITDTLRNLENGVAKLTALLKNVISIDNIDKIGLCTVKWPKYFMYKKQLESSLKIIHKSRINLMALLQVYQIYRSERLGHKIDSIKFIGTKQPSEPSSEAEIMIESSTTVELLSNIGTSPNSSTNTLVNTQESDTEPGIENAPRPEGSVAKVMSATSPSAIPLWTEKIVVTTSPVTTCASSCDCICHQGSRLTTPKWLRGMLGTLFSNYEGKPILVACTKPRCKRDDAITFSLHYMFPAWALQRALSLTYTWSTVNGADGKLAFRIPRVLPLNEVNSIYAILRTASAQDLGNYMTKMRIKPFDLDDKGRSLAHTAAWASNYDQYRWLVDFGADPNLPDDQGLSAIDAWVGYFLALPDAKREIWRKRIDYPRWKDSIDRMRLSIIHDVVLGIADPSITIKNVLQYRTNVDQRDKIYGRTALFWASVRADVPSVTELLSHGADPHMADAKGYTAAHWAAWNGSVSCIAALLESSASSGAASPGACSMDGRTALHVAAQCAEDRAEVMELLVRHGAALEVPDAQGKTPLHRAAEKGRAEHVRILVRSGADVEARSRLGFTPLISAVEYNSVENARILIELGANYGVIDDLGGNILHHVALWAGLELMNMLKGLPLVGVEPGLCDREGRNPLDCFEQQRDKHYGAQRVQDAEKETKAFKDLLESVTPMTPQVVPQGRRGQLEDVSQPEHGTMPGSWNFAWEEESGASLALTACHSL